MADQATFTDLIRRVRAGDDVAAAEIVRQYEPEIRREVRIRLADSKLRRVFDSMDICQSVMLGFFVRAGSGQYDLDRPEELLRLLVGMTRNKLNFQIRKQHALKRDSRRTTSEETQLGLAVARGESPSQIVEGRDLLEAFRGRLTAEERRLADCRAQGMDWAEVAKLTGSNPDACRKQLARAIERVADELGLEKD